MVRKSVKANHKTERPEDCYRVSVSIQYHDSITPSIKEHFENENDIPFLLHQKIVEKNVFQERCKRFEFL